MLLLVIVVVTIAAYILGQFVYSRQWSNHLDIYADFNKDCYNRGDTGIFIETIINRKLIPIPLLVLSFGLDKSMKFIDCNNVISSDRNYRSDCFSLFANHEGTRTFEIMFTQRGMYETGELSVFVTDLFGRAKYGSHTDGGDIIYVYPARIANAEIEAVFTKLTGEYYNRRFLYEDPFEFKGMRDYAPTDPMKKINWGAYARTGELKVNQYYDTRGLNVTIYLNMEPEGVAMKKYLAEAAIEIARTLIENFLHQGVAVRLVTNACDMVNGIVVPEWEGTGIGHLDGCLKQLARLDVFKYEEDFEEVLSRRQMDREGSVLPVLISVCQKKSLIKAYEQYLKNEIGAMIVPVKSIRDGVVNSDLIDVKYMEVDKE